VIAVASLQPLVVFNCPFWHLYEHVLLMHAGTAPVTAVVHWLSEEQDDDASGPPGVVIDDEPSTRDPAHPQRSAMKRSRFMG